MKPSTHSEPIVEPNAAPLEVANAPSIAEQAASDAPAPTEDLAPKEIRKGPGLSTKLLLLTISFIMLAEVLIFLPSIANFRHRWLEDRLNEARIASLAVDLASDGQLPASFASEILKSTGVKSIAVRRNGRKRLIVKRDMPPIVDAYYDLRDTNWIGLIGNAFMVLVTPDDRMMAVRGNPSMSDPDDYVEVIMPQKALCQAMIQYGLNILLLSILISLLAGTLVYLALNALLVQPISRITESMVGFSRNPEDANRIISWSGRTDEIGVAESQLASMQHELSQALRQKSRLAALGLAVSKVNHDLRNILSSAQLISDRLGSLKDPTVKRVAPKLVKSLDRAIALCTSTLRYGRAEEREPERDVILLAPLIAEVGEGLGLPRPGELEWLPHIPDGLTVDGDREQLYRVLSNICRNAAQVLDAHYGPMRSSGAEAVGSISIIAERIPSSETDGAGLSQKVASRIFIQDNGPGVPEKARQHLFQPFQGSMRQGGTGLGLAIAAELIEAHGGTLRLVETATGATFEIIIPDR